MGTGGPATTRDASKWAAATMMAALIGVAFIMTWLIGDHQPPAGQSKAVLAEPLVILLSYGVAGSVLIDRRPDLPFGWLLGGAAALVALGFAVMLPSYDAVAAGSRSDLALWGLTGGSFLFLPVAVQGLVNVRFPSGRPATRRGAVLEVAIIVGTLIVVARGFLGATAISEVMGDSSPVRNPLTGGTAVGRFADSLLVLAPIVVLLGLIAGLGVVVRFFRARGIERQQLKWRTVGVLLSLALYPLAVTQSLGHVGDADSAVFVLTLAVPVLRYRLWAIDTILRRSAVYAAVTAVLVGVYVAVSAAVARLASYDVAAPAAAVVIALLFAPLRMRAQRVIDRLFYGDRSDPYRTISELGRRLQVRPHDEVPGSLVATVARSLRLPYVALEQTNASTLAASGAPGRVTQRWPLTYEGQVEGYLVASPRRGEESFDHADDEVLADIARQAGVVVRAQTLTDALQRSRQRLVTAGEEERRRLRRDLHDGLGPVLTGAGLSLDVARARLTGDPEAAARHLADAKDAVTQALDDIRRIARGLRPPAIDDLGLVGALRGQAARMQGGDVHVTVEADGLPLLPAAIEVAAFRTAVEAMTNSVRHGGGHECLIRLTASPGKELLVEVSDDGMSDGPWVPGVGLTAMRERAAELGGTLAAGPTASGGAVVARLPLPAGGP